MVLWGEGRTHPGHMQSMGHRWDSPGEGCWRRWNAQTGCEQRGLVLLSKLMETQNGNGFTHRCFYKKACFITQYRGSSSRLCVDPYSSAGQRMSEHYTVIIFFSVWAWYSAELFLSLLLSVYSSLPCLMSPMYYHSLHIVSVILSHIRSYADV